MEGVSSASLGSVKRYCQVSAPLDLTEALLLDLTEALLLNLTETFFIA
ncbi:MAG: hypothetical protein ACRC3B_21575 [Bacteroidia bacterium]